MAPTANFTSDIGNIVFALDATFATAFQPNSIEVISSTSAQVTSIFGTATFTGTGFALSGLDAFTGTIDQFTFTYDFTPLDGLFEPSDFGFDFDTGAQVTVSDFNFEAGDIFEAYDLEADGDIDAAENLLVPLDWNLTGNDLANEHLEGATTFDGVVVDFTGDNRIDLAGGEDHFWAGGGDDTVFGGTGNDTLLGGDGNDVIKAGKQRDVVHGGDGKDNIFGGKGKDRITGGDGNDRLRGDVGNDTLEGGASRDKMTGGTDADRFVFDVTGNTRTGADTITDFDTAEDTLNFIGNSAADVSVALSGGDVLVTHDGGTILLEGVTDVAGVEDALMF